MIRYRSATESRATAPSRVSPVSGAMMTALAVLCLSLAALPFIAGMALPAAPQCDLALVLAMDASGSIDAKQHEMIRKGTADALRHPAVASAFGSGRVALRVTEYAERTRELVPWTMIGGAVDLDIIASVLADTPRSGAAGSLTAMGVAMVDARQSFDTLPCAHNVLDILADGENGIGIRPEAARVMFREGTDQINVLLVEAPAAAPVMETRVIFGEGAFVMEVDGFEQIGRAMMRKLLLEVSMGLSGRIPA